MLDVVIAYCINEKNEVLIAQRPKEPFKDFYECPGGKREDDESLIEALNRELYEELGTRIHVAHYLFYYDVKNVYGDFRMHWFKVVLKQTIQSSFYQSFKWVHPDRLLDYPWIEHNLKYMKTIQRTCTLKPQSFMITDLKDLELVLTSAHLKEKIHLSVDG